MKNSMLILTLMVAALCGCAAQQPTNPETPESSVLVEVTPETSSEATPTATPAPTPDPTPVPTAEPTATPTPIAAPTAKPTPAPTEAPAATAAPVQQAEASQQVSMSYGAVPFDLAAGPFASASSVCAAWQSSPDHYASIVSPNYSSMGIGCWFCSTEAGQYTYWAVTFQ